MGIAQVVGAGRAYQLLEVLQCRAELLLLSGLVLLVDMIDLSAEPLVLCSVVGRKPSAMSVGNNQYVPNYLALMLARRSARYDVRVSLVFLGNVVLLSVLVNHLDFLFSSSGTLIFFGCNAVLAKYN